MQVSELLHEYENCSLLTLCVLCIDLKSIKRAVIFGLLGFNSPYNSNSSKEISSSPFENSTSTLGSPDFISNI